MNCKSKVSIPDIHNHDSVVHRGKKPKHGAKKSGVCNTQNLDGKTEQVNGSVRVKYQNKSFYFVIWQREEAFYMWLTVLGSKETAERFVFDLKISNAKKNPTKILKIRETAIPVDFSADEAVQMENCVVIPMTKIKQFLNENDGFHYTIKIKELQQRSTCACF